MSDPRRLLVVESACAECDRVSALDKDGVKDFLKFGVPVYWADVLHQSLIAPHPPQWCGAFALWNLHKADLGLELRWVFGPPNYGFLYKLHKLERHEVPEPGDIAYLNEPYQHHAIVACVEGDNVITINGNQVATEPIQKKTAPLSHWSAFYSIASLLLEPEEVA